MLLTHSLLTVYLVIFCVIYLLINIKKIDKKTFLTLLTNAGIILLLSAFYWLPLLQTKLSTDYEVFNDEHMIRWDAMIALKAKTAELAFYVPGRMFYGIGILVIIGTALSFTILKPLLLSYFISESIKVAGENKYNFEFSNVRYTAGELRQISSILLSSQKEMFLINVLLLFSISKRL